MEGRELMILFLLLLLLLLLLYFISCRWASVIGWGHVWAGWGKVLLVVMIKI